MAVLEEKKAGKRAEELERIKLTSFEFIHHIVNNT